MACMGMVTTLPFCVPNGFKQSDQAHALGQAKEDPHCESPASLVPAASAAAEAVDAVAGPRHQTGLASCLLE